MRTGGYVLIGEFMRPHKKHLSIKFLSVMLLLFFINACVTTGGMETPPASEMLATQTDVPIPTLTSTPLVPPNTNPLTGLHVEDPSLLDLPALLVSISHFPVNARPQAGLSFAPWVFEIYITEGATRFLAVFHGEFPEPENPINGDCPVRGEPLAQAGIGRRVWLDSNGNHMQDDWERGVGGVCVYLFDEGGQLLQQTSTDSNGYYGFDVEAGRYVIRFQKPARMEFAQKHAGDGERDSDADPVTGQTEAFDVNTPLLHVDAGLTQSSNPFPASDLPAAKVGPIRSGRLIYADIAAFFPDSCLIYAFASPEVLEKLPACFFVSHDIDSGGYMLGIDELQRLARESRNGAIDYSINRFDKLPPSGGVDASRLHVYIAYLNQSAWAYDAASQSYWRYVDKADFDNAGLVYPDSDRLTDRQLQFENVIVVFAEHDVVSPTNLDIHLEENKTGAALLFRDGQRYDISWSTEIGAEEIQTGRRTPIRFVGADGKTLMPLKPGRTWIVVVTPETVIREKGAGNWELRFVQPEGAK